MTRIELENKHMMEQHELRRLRLNAGAFTLMAELAKNEDDKQSALDTVSYWDTLIDQSYIRLESLEQQLATV